MDHLIPFHLYIMRPSLRWLLSYGLSAPNLTPHTQLWGAGPGTLQTIFPLGLLGTPGMDAGGRLEAGVERGDLFPVILVGPGCNHMHPYKKKAGRSNSDTQSRSHTKRRGQHDPGGQWVDWRRHRARDAKQGHSLWSWKRRGTVHPQSAQREHSPAHCLAFRLWAPELSEHTATVVSHQVGSN